MTARTNHARPDQPHHGPHIEPRVSRLEGVVEGLDDDIKALSTNFDRMAKNTSDALQRQYDMIERQSSQFSNAISALQTTIAGSGKANWPVLFSACGLVLAISATVGGLAMQPWKDRHTTLESRVDRVQAQAATNATDIASQYVRNAEIETQFRAAKELEEMRYEMGMAELRHVRELMAVRSQPALPATATP